MKLTKEVVGYSLRDDIPQVHSQFKDDKDRVIIRVNKVRPGDVTLTDEAAYNAAVQARQDERDVEKAAEEAAALTYQADIEALRLSGQANLIAGNPLTSDEAYVMMYQKLP